MLLIKKTYFEAIRSGTKTATLRFWRRRAVAPGSVHKVRGLGVLRVDQVRQVDLHELTDADAEADGFESLGGLRRALDELYPPADRAGRRLYQLHFTYLGPAWQAGSAPKCAPADAAETA